MLGKFISPDSFVPNPANPGLFNRFAYVSNNPLIYTDPSGFSCEGGSVDDPVGCEFQGGSNTTSNPNANPTLSAPYYGPPAPNMWQVIWEDTRDIVHTSLDGAGTVPGFGIAADGLNAGLYLLEGDLRNAGYSGIALIPLIGTAGPVLRNADNAASLGRALPDELAGGAADTYIYTGRRGGDDVYGGITNNPLRREAQHGDRFDGRLNQLNPNDPVTRGEARAIEQAFIVTSKQAGVELQNKINSISPLRSFYDQAVAFGEDWLGTRGLTPGQ